jgi:MFS family permease
MAYTSVAGMYALSPVFGWLADRLGRTRVLTMGAVLLSIAGAICAAADDDAVLLGAGLALLGLGWSAGLVAGSALLTESVPLRVRAGAQGLSDVAMNVSGAVGGIAGGLVVAGASFAVLGVAVSVLVVPYLLAAGAVALRAPRTVAA